MARKPPSPAGTGSSGRAWCTSSWGGGWLRKICCSNPNSTPPMDWPSGCFFFGVVMVGRSEVIDGNCRPAVAQARRMGR